MNRNNWSEWDISSRIKSKIKENIYWNRKTDSINKCLSHYLNDLEFDKFEAIIDFSAYKKKDIKNVISQLLPNNKFKTYILISTDSVYEVCQHLSDQNESIETDSIRPECDTLRERLNSLDSYGNHKLKCEEYLIDKSNEQQFSYIILRLADVIGPRDSTERFWLIQMYLEYLNFKNSSQIEISNEYFNKKTSYVYVYDVAKVILSILKSNIKNEIFNIGFDVNLSINELYQKMATVIDSNFNLNFIQTNKDINHPFPSVNKSININKIKRILNFEPTSIEQALNETIQFYKNAYSKFPNEMKSIEKCLKKEYLKKDEHLLFNTFINNKILKN